MSNEFEVRMGKGNLGASIFQFSSKVPRMPPGLTVSSFDE